MLVHTDFSIFIGQRRFQKHWLGLVTILVNYYPDTMLMRWYEHGDSRQSSWEVRTQGKPLKISTWLKVSDFPYKSDFVLNMWQHCVTKTVSWGKNTARKISFAVFPRSQFGYVLNKIAALQTAWFVWLGQSFFGGMFELWFSHWSRPCEVW